MKLYIATPINARPEQGFRNKYKAAQKRVRELKESYFNEAIKNIKGMEQLKSQKSLFD